MSNKDFLNLVIESIRNSTEENNWRGTLSNWIKC